MSELTIREMGQDEDFSAWFSELLEQEDATTGSPGGMEEHYLILSNEIGDWIGGLRVLAPGWSGPSGGRGSPAAGAASGPRPPADGGVRGASGRGGRARGRVLDRRRAVGRLLGALGWRRIFQRAAVASRRRLVLDLAQERVALEAVAHALRRRRRAAEALVKRRALPEPLERGPRPPPRSDRQAQMVLGVDPVDAQLEAAAQRGDRLLVRPCAPHASATSRRLRWPRPPFPTRR